MNPMQIISVLQGDQQEYLELLYEKYLKSPESIPEDWKQLFDSLERREKSVSLIVDKTFQPEDIPYEISSSDLNLKVHKLIQDYRRQGHYVASTDPLEMRKFDLEEFFNLAKYEIQKEDLDKLVTIDLGKGKITDKVSNIIKFMEQTYCSTIGFEFFYIRDEKKRNWIIQNVETGTFFDLPSAEEVLNIYKKLFSAEYFEKFLAIKFPGKKRFSLEGSESLIPGLITLVEESANYNVEQIVLGMAHRGRLNVLANVLGKDAALIFSEFNENISEEIGMGDVKYHLGYSTDYVTKQNRSIHLSLAFNPSHLEVINPVVMGSVRARQRKTKDLYKNKVMGVLIHGDSAICGQGINYEMINMANLQGYSVEGIIHIVINNQIGFTTLPSDYHSMTYVTDISKLLQSPILHVNGDDPIALYKAIQLAVKWRNEFKTDIFIDIISFRRWGHNETDEPTFTQPKMYQIIKKHPGTFAKFENKIAKKIFDLSILEKVKNEYIDYLNQSLKRYENENIKAYIQTLTDQWKGLKKIDLENDPDTSISEETLKKITERITTVPENFTLHPKLARLFSERKEMIFENDKRKIDWGMAETLSFGSLIFEGFPIRISGQDSKRGTFSHRHAAVNDYNTGEEYIPLKHLVPNQVEFEIYNSLLSEEAVLAFEFGYSLADPNTLVIWEAQFGDFANGAQVIIDQFITSSEAKWQRMSGLVMLLPHGYEGQGPEHSSARLERYLQLCSQHNIQVIYPTTPAQIFHSLRRQLKRNYRKPLIVMSPKSLLRHPECVSSLSELTSGKFRQIIEETDEDILPENVQKLLFCTGKIYYELREYRRSQKIKNIAIIRVEELYPFPAEQIMKILEIYPYVKEYAWVQEEPRNQGAWIYMENHLGHITPKKLNYYGRVASPSPATGYYKVHLKEQEMIIKESLKI